MFQTLCKRILSKPILMRPLIAVAALCLASLSLAHAGDETPQAATPDDIKIFEPYIGKFQSDTRVFDNSDTEYFFTVTYAWFDRDKTIVKYIVAMEIPAQDRVIVNAEGFYGYDPFNERLYVFGAFTRGMTGWGSVGRFDHETGARETWAKSKGPDGVVTHVRDTFERINDNEWRNVTFIRTENETTWRQVVEDHYKRTSA